MSDLERKCEETRLTALLNEAYYRHRAASLARWDLWIRIIVAGSGLVALGTAITQIDGVGPELWRWFVALAAVASVSSPILQLSEGSRACSELAMEWSHLAGEFDRMLVQPMTAEERVAFQLDLLQTSTALQRKDTAPRRTRLARKLQGEIRVQEGIVSA